MKTSTGSLTLENNKPKCIINLYVIRVIQKIFNGWFGMGTDPLEEIIASVTDRFYWCSHLM